MSRCKGHCGGCNTRPWPPSQNLQGENAERRWIDNEIHGAYHVHRGAYTVRICAHCAIRVGIAQLMAAFDFSRFYPDWSTVTWEVYRAGWVTLVPTRVQSVYIECHPTGSVTAQ